MKLLSMLLGQSYYVLDDISINEVGPDYVFIKTRKGGFFAWLCGLFGFKTTQEFHLFPDRIETEMLGGSKKKNVLSLSSVSLIDCEYVVPSSFLIMAVLFLIPIVTIPLSVICLLLYFRNKKILITATANSGDKISIFFKPTDGFGYEQGKQVLDAIKQLLILQHSIQEAQSQLPVE